MSVLKNKLEFYELIQKRLKGGDVLRYHTRPEVAEKQDVAAHSWRSLVLLTTLWPDASKNSILFVLYHDVAELEIGDVPATTKWKYKDLAKTLTVIENDYEDLLCLPVKYADLSEEEQQRVKIVDILELVFHCHKQMQKGNSLASDIFYRGIDFLYSNFKYSKDYVLIETVLEKMKGEP